MDKDEKFITTNQVKTFLKENAQAYMVLSTLKVEKDVVVSDVLIVSEFLEVFLEDGALVLLVKKKDERMRSCVDYHQLNKKPWFVSLD
ncbi:hypothetical protein CR513_04421, partial [Mucuna pruriens]